MPDLASWNKIGRETAAHNSAKITAFHEGRVDSPNLNQDPRTPELAQAAFAEVVAMNDAGRGAEVRARFDRPAHHSSPSWRKVAAV